MRTWDTILGQRFGRLVVTARAGSTASGARLWRCKCDCGKETIAGTYRLRHGCVKSCGCYRSDSLRQRYEASRHRNFWNRVDRRGDDECWEWRGRLNEDGYGKLRFRSDDWAAHRLSWFLCFGEIPEGMCVLHHCDNPKCVNPVHLFLGTHADNMRDMAQKGRRKHIGCGEDNSSAKLTVSDVRCIHELRARGATQQAIADRFEVTQAHVSRILLGHVWENV